MSQGEYFAWFLYFMVCVRVLRVCVALCVCWVVCFVWCVTVLVFLCVWRTVYASGSVSVFKSGGVRVLRGLFLSRCVCGYDGTCVLMGVHQSCHFCGFSGLLQGICLYLFLDFWWNMLCTVSVAVSPCVSRGLCLSVWL